MSEKMVKVTSFGELRQTDLVVVFCDWPGCGARHRGMLLGTFTDPAGVHQPDGTRVMTAGWVLLPRHPKAKASGRLVITPLTVARGIVFKVDVGIEAPAATTRTKRPLTTKGQ